MPPGNGQAHAVEAPATESRQSARVPDISTVVEALQIQEAPEGSSEFAIALSFARAHFAVDVDRRGVLLVPTSPGRAPLGRDVGGLSISFGDSLRFRMSGRTWDCSAAVLTCLDEALLPTFCALALDVAMRTSTGPTDPTPREVSDAIATWERLLRSRRRLTPEEEAGLWGELWLLSQMTNVDDAIAAWQGPSRAPIDFFFGQTALECKTSGKRLTHHISQSQFGRPAGDASVYFVSLWVGPDPLGTSLPELVTRINDRVSSPTEFEAKLLDIGYSRLDAALYRERFAVREPPVVFPEAAVPRVRSFDPGISAIRFTAVLDELAALEGAAAARLLRGPVA